MEREIKFCAWHKGYSAKGKLKAIPPSMIYVKSCPDSHLYFAPYDERYSENSMIDGENGYYNPKHAELLELPVFEMA